MADASPTWPQGHLWRLHRPGPCSCDQEHGIVDPFCANARERLGAALRASLRLDYEDTRLRVSREEFARIQREIESPAQTVEPLRALIEALVKVDGTTPFVHKADLLDALDATATTEEDPR